MRSQLAVREGDLTTFKATFGRYGFKKGRFLTVLLVGVRDQRGNRVCSHLWLNLTIDFMVLNVRPGDRVRFRARVLPYHNATDYKLTSPIGLEVVGRG